MVVRLLLLLMIVENTLTCSPCPSSQNNSPKDDICRRDANKHVNTYVFEGVIKDALEIIKDSNEIQENINNADQTNYDVEITKIYQDILNSLTFIKLPRIRRMKVSKSCKPMCTTGNDQSCIMLELGQTYLLAANNAFEYGRCNVYKLADQITPEDMKWLNGTNKCS